MNTSKKRKTDSDSEAPVSCKRLKRDMLKNQDAQVTPDNVQAAITDLFTQASAVDTGSSRRRDPQSMNPDSIAPKKRRINKLVPPRPFPTVPTSVSATGPRSAHKEGKNFICITRKTALGAYMRRCKDIVLKDGYKTLHFNAMGAAIPLLLQLVVALPPILPFADDEVTSEVTTGTVEVQDEVIPDDEDDDLTYETRGKSTLRIMLRFGNGEYEGDKSSSVKKSRKSRANGQGIRGTSNRSQQKAAQIDTGDIVLQEPEQEEMEML
ncbi:hypothetical protein H0H87_012541 [Tephrocybe sp. NHM501043]|nr:hypothetical protein H0H87_012541 [Tephrocybe sp. NHM501043]